MPNGNNVTTSTELVSQVIDSENTLHGIRAGAIPYGEVDATSTSTVFTATVPGIVTLTDGVCALLRNGQVTSAANFTLNVNNLGAKPVYNNLATGNDVANPPTVATRDTTIFNVAYTMLFIYTTSNKFNDGNGAWICFRGYDSNTNTIGYQLRTNSSNMVASDTGYKYRIWLTSADGTKWVPINTSTSINNTTARTLNTRIIDPFGAIVYRATNGTCTAGSGLGATSIWQQYTLTIGYSYVKTLTYPAPVYLKCTPQTAGGAKMQDIVQALPASKDGKIYIFLGIAYSATAMELQIVHPVYWHDGDGIRLWTGAEAGSDVSVTQVQTSGTKIATITVDGAGTDIYAPAASSVSPATANPIMDGTAAVGTSNKYAREDHVHPTDTSRQATLVSGTNIKTVGGNSLLGSGNIAFPSVPTASTVSPLMDGIAAAGTSAKYAREDHVHPTDTSKVNALFASGNINNNIQNNEYGIQLISTDSQAGTYGDVYIGVQGGTISSNSTTSSYTIQASPAGADIYFTVFSPWNTTTIANFSTTSVTIGDGTIPVNISGVSTPVNDSDAVPKSYVDDLVMPMTEEEVYLVTVTGWQDTSDAEGVSF